MKYSNKHNNPMNRKLFLSILAALLGSLTYSYACTGISLKSKDGSYVMARTIEWGSSELNSVLCLIPRGYSQTSMTPTGKNGISFKAKYGYVGVGLATPDFIGEGLNEAGLSAGLFYYPNYGGYEKYDASKKEPYLADMQVVAWILSQFSTVQEVKEHFEDVKVISLFSSDKDAPSETGYGSATAIHWRVGDPSGAQIVIEIENGKVNIYDNPVGVLTNAPGFKWHLQNLNNYVNLYPGSAKAWEMGSRTISQFGAGSGFLGIPGDVTPPSRFVRAAFYVATAPVRNTSFDTAMECFTILDNFNIPIGIEYPMGQAADLPSATQWTSVSDLTNRVFYYKTMYNSTVRKVNLKDIDFSKASYQKRDLDEQKTQKIEEVHF